MLGNRTGLPICGSRLPGSKAAKRAAMLVKPYGEQELAPAVAKAASASHSDAAG
ncbi:MAG TPA: hypothetical protein VEZ24_06040 [Microvirga sp.]|nr:hypothetical protein [Microvirga sp.]